jgi:hypothetical protein
VPQQTILLDPACRGSLQLKALVAALIAASALVLLARGGKAAQQEEEAAAASSEDNQELLQFILAPRFRCLCAGAG